MGRGEGIDGCRIGGWGRRRPAAGRTEGNREERSHDSCSRHFGASGLRAGAGMLLREPAVYSERPRTSGRRWPTSGPRHPCCRDGPRIAEAIAGCGVPIETAADMADAVRVAARAAWAGDAVLLSPACASLDQFASYVERGERFAARVRARLAEPAAHA